MKKIIILLVLLTSCINRNVKTIQDSSALFGNIVNIEYKHYDEVVLEARESAKINMLSVKDTRKEIRQLPKGGYIIVKIAGVSIESGNTRNFRYVVKKGGVKIYDRVGSYRMPSYSNGYWINADIILIKNKFKTIEVYVIDNLSVKRWIYEVKGGE